MGRLLTDGAEGMWSSPNTYCDHYCFYVALFSALEQTHCSCCSSVLLCWISVDTHCSCCSSVLLYWVPVGRLAALVAVQFYCAGFLWTDSLHLLQFSFIVQGSCGQTHCSCCSSVLLCWISVGRLAALIAVQFYCAWFLWADWLRLLQFSFIVLGSCGQTGCACCSSVLMCWVPVPWLTSSLAFQHPSSKLCRIGDTTKGGGTPSLSLRICPPTLSGPLKGLGTNKTEEAI